MSEGVTPIPTPIPTPTPIPAPDAAHFLALLPTTPTAQHHERVAARMASDYAQLCKDNPIAGLTPEMFAHHTYGPYMLACSCSK
jgi:hypothetical protein